MTASKILSNIVLGVIGFVAVAMILLAIIPKSYGIGVSNEPYLMTIYGASTSASDSYSKNSTESEKAVYEKIASLYNASLSTSSLNALFSKKILENATYDYSNTSLSALVSKSNSVVLEFKFTTLQTLYKDGAPYKNDRLTNTFYTDNILTYGKVWIVVSDTNGLGTMDFYFQKLDTKGSPASSSNYSIIKVSTCANSHNLYEYLLELKNKIN